MCSPAQTLVRSANLSWFVHRDGIYCYHDVFGHTLAMSRDMATLLEAFARPRAVDEVVARTVARARDALDASCARDAIETFREHDFLLAPGSDEHQILVRRIPIKARWRVVYRESEGRFVAMLGRNLSTPPRPLALEGAAAALWRRIDGEHTVQELASSLWDAGALPTAQSVADAQTFVSARIAAWTHSEVQLTRTHTTPLSFYARSSPPPHVVSTMPFARLQSVVARHSLGVDGVPEDEPRAWAEADIIDLSAYHQHTIDDAQAQFEDVETTLSHLFRQPHPALGGATYAQRVVARCFELGLLTEATREVAEVGGGTGIFASQTVAALRARLGEGAFRYRVLDLSPALHNAQRYALAPYAEASVVLGDGQAPPFPPNSLDFVVSNEVIADFRTARLRHEVVPPVMWEDPDAALALLEEDDAFGGADSVAGEPEALALIARYGLDVREAPREFLFNLGAVQFVEALWTVLRPGGAAFVTEFGHRWKSPIESTHLDHAEVSIHFGHLAAVARALGFVVELHDLADLLGLEGDREALAATQTWFRNLRALAKLREVELPKLAWTPELLRAACEPRLELERLEALHWERLDERVMGLRPHEFMALVLRKPAAC